ncbi:helix-turn-helix transcriptional regulator [Inconstantimicrobium mannanitabidum]|uniref:Transcriptional regulator n=1 Tax=Inconstantimicrobium mannanitabidum TaxID=1604901 RepID=A0ACB5R9R5_9CLOT|nr:helix-turn-helix transcriptional regulator [Clostridium sp. TW13]GKX65604.1 transcriptional regulator [Clostridium sp. TW13]
MKGEVLKKLRDSKHLTQNQLAKELNISGSSIRMYETNKRTPTLETAKAIAEFFNVTVEDLDDIDCIEGNDKASLAVVDKLIDKLIESNIITDVNNIDPDTEELIAYAVKLQIDKKIKEKS